MGFHSDFATAAPKSDAKASSGKLLFCIGGNESMIPPDKRLAFEAEMLDAGVDWQMHLYGRTVHSFTNTEAARRNMPYAIRYSAEADTRSWAALRLLFDETLAAQG